MRDDEPAMGRKHPEHWKDPPKPRTVAELVATRIQQPADRSAAVHLRGRFLPDGRQAEVWIVDGRITWEPVSNARTITSSGWILPALVDAHVHIGIAEIGGPLDLDVLDADIAQLARTGIGAARVLGSPAPLPAAAHARGGGPILQSAGIAVAAPDRFIPGWGRRVSGPDIAATCAEEARFGWSKIIADWFDDSGGYGPAFSQADIAAAVSAVHEEGARVAVHTQSAAGGQAAVAAGVDSIEHGMHLPESALVDLAANGGFLVPTGSVFTQQAPAMAGADVPELIRDWFATGLQAHAGLVQKAQKLGVTVLAGTDLPVGALIDELQWLNSAGMSAEEAIGAASWTAREVLDLPRLREGDRADVIWSENDPRDNLEELRTPDLVIIDGQVSVDGLAD